MSNRLYENDVSLVTSPYSTLRGYALHRLMPEVVGKPGWVDLRKLRPKTFTAMLFDIALCLDCDITPQFLLQNPEAMSWIAKSYRILFKCLLDDWRMTNVLLVEAELPTISLPDGREIRCGVPDMFGVSEAYEGAISVELKSGFRRTKTCGAKLARYNSGAKLLTDDLGLAVPFRGTIWASFASTKQDAYSNRYLWAKTPVITHDFIPYRVERIDEVLQRKYGVDTSKMAGLPRHYSGLSFASAA